jgi:hypothetical protein
MLHEISNFGDSFVAVAKKPGMGALAHKVAISSICPLYMGRLLNGTNGIPNIGRRMLCNDTATGIKGAKLALPRTLFSGTVSPNGFHIVDIRRRF